ncbi:MAG: hypothetical protein GXO48_01925 [Chlorobi bacterium]|nr:hypothetical protein [Chlorobiota bacterium]
MQNYDKPLVKLPVPHELSEQWLSYWISVIENYMDIDIQLVHNNATVPIEASYIRHLISETIKHFSGNAEPSNIPIIDIMIKEFHEKLQSSYNVRIGWKPEFKFLLTFDIDIAYQFKGRPLYKHVLAFFRDAIIRPNTALKRLKFFLTGSDPFDTIPLELPVKPQLVFIYVGEGKSKHDPKLNLLPHQWKEIIHSWRRVASVHWHPSLYASQSFENFKQEFNKWLNLANKEYKDKVRFHYLNIDIQNHGQWLEKLGIKEDFSLGRYHPPFFKAGTSMPFRPFSLSENRPFNFIEYPVIAMDVSFTELTSCPQEAIEKFKDLVNKVRQVGGTMHIIIHPEKALGLEIGYEKWRPFYNFVFQVLQEQ